MARNPKVDAGIEAIPSPQWVKDRADRWQTASLREHGMPSVDKWDVGRKREVGGGVKLLVDMKKTGNRTV